MKIYILIDGSEVGPYSKPEVFALLKDGAVSMDSPARIENEEAHSLLSEVLNRDTKQFFTVAEIEQRQIEDAIQPIVVPDLLQPARESSGEPITATRRRRRILLPVAALVAAGVTAVLMHFNRPADEPPPVIAEASNIAEPETAAQMAISTPAPTPQTLVRVSTPTPTPEQIEIVEVTPTPEPGIELAVQEANPTPPPPEPTPLEPSYEVVDIPGSGEKGNTQLWVARFSEKPAGLLLLCIDKPIVTHKPPMRDWANWKAFAQKNHLVLAMTGFLEKEENSSAMLEYGLRELGLTELPALIYGFGPGGRFIAEFAPAHPGTVKGWASFDNFAKPDPTKGIGQPALLITDYETSKITDLRSRFEEGRNQKQKWTLLTIASDAAKRRDDAGTFVRSYFEALLNYQGEGDKWVSLDRAGLADYVEMAQSPGKVAWLPSGDLVEPWRALMPKVAQTFDPVVIRKTVKTNIPQQPEFEMFLRLPPKGSGVPKPTGILAFTTWSRNSKDIEKQLLYRTDMKLPSASGPAGIVARLIRYAEENNLAVLTWNSNRFWRNDLNTWELSKEKRAEFDRAFDRIAIAWQLGLREVLKETGISDKDMLLYGISRGATWAQRLAVRMPHYFIAAHLHVPSSFDTPTEQANNMLWLVTTGESDGGYERSIKFYEQCRALNYPILFKAIMNSGHGDHPTAQNLGFRFFDYALELRRARLAAAEKETNPLKKKEILSAQLWMSSFQEPPFVGDFLNQEMFPLSQVDMIPDALRVPLPNEQLAEAWNK